MEIKEAQEIIRAGLAWANWTDEQKEAMRMAIESMDKVKELDSLLEKMKMLEANPYTKIVMFLNQRKYSYTVTDVIRGYQQKDAGYYVSHTMNDCIKNLESEIVSLLKEQSTIQ